MKTSTVMNFLRKISKFQINQAWKGNNRLLNSLLNYVVVLKRANFYVMVVNGDYYESRCSKCPPSALIHACSLFLNTRTSFLIDSCAKSFQRAFRGRFSVLSYLSTSVCRLDISQAYHSFIRLVIWIKKKNFGKNFFFAL